MNETLTPDVSLDGKRNAYYVRCKRVGFSRPYAACVNDISIKNRGAASNSVSPCEIAITSQTCPGISMRKEELAEERAIYFVERIKPVKTATVELDQLIQAPQGNIPFQGVKTGEMVVITGGRRAGKSYLNQLLTNPASYADAINSFNHSKETENV